MRDYRFTRAGHHQLCTLLLLLLPLSQQQNGASSPWKSQPCWIIISLDCTPTRSETRPRVQGRKAEGQSGMRMDRWRGGTDGLSPRRRINLLTCRRHGQCLVPLRCLWLSSETTILDCLDTSYLREEEKLTHVYSRAK
jgi:hypothetical protein